MKYIQSYLEKNCSCELQYLFSQSRNPYKEISESMGAYKNMLPYIHTKDKDHAYIFIGDGSLAMTGVLFSFLTKGICISIDPLLSIDKLQGFADKFKVSNFYKFKSNFQDVRCDVFKDMMYDIVCVHAHVDLKEVHKLLPKWGYLYSNPCCHRNKQMFDLQYQKENNISVISHGIDNNILSDKNEVVIYKNEKTFSIGNL